MGHACVYTAENRALSVLESLVHVQPNRVPPDLVMLAMEIPENLPRETWSEHELPDDWRAIGANSAVNRGTMWLESTSAAVLWVPSAVLPAEQTALLNPGHPSHAEIRIVDQTPFQFGARLLGVRTGTPMRPKRP